MRHISFLLGAGFSRPAGFRLARELGERLLSIQPSQISIYNDGGVYLSGVDNDSSNPYTRSGNPYKRRDKQFVCSLLAYYSKEVMSADEFDYESFYDFYHNIRVSESYDRGSPYFNEPDESFARHFVENNPNPFGHNPDWCDDFDSLLSSFDKNFNQILKRVLLEHVDTSLSLDPRSIERSAYKQFLKLIDDLFPLFRIHIHSLNHDELVEWLARESSWCESFSDGFDELGSNVYGDSLSDDDNYRIRMQKYKGKYDVGVNLYKLHGGLDYYWIRENPDQLIKLKGSVHRHRVLIEDVTGSEAAYKRVFVDIYPDFLSGRKIKEIRYDAGDYYPGIHARFEENLKNSDMLIVIGYSFCDGKINERIEKSFIEQGKPIVIVDKCAKDVEVDKCKKDVEWLRSADCIWMTDGVEGINVEQIKSKLGIVSKAEHREALDWFQDEL